MKKILAAGGIVINQFNEILLIYRYSMWDLPKGHLEKNETLEACALREVSEETELHTLEFVGYVGITEHVYFHRKFKEEVTKQTHWFEFRADKNEDLHPQIVEGIERVIWVPKAEVKKYVRNSFDNIKEILMQCSLF